LGRIQHYPIDLRSLRAWRASRLGRGQYMDGHAVFMHLSSAGIPEAMHRRIRRNADRVACLRALDFWSCLACLQVRGIQSAATCSQKLIAQNLLKLGAKEQRWLRYCYCVCLSFKRASEHSRTICHMNEPNASARLTNRTGPQLLIVVSLSLQHHWAATRR
jgi:hypothetical protein